jgi:NDP-sugar pyrophosphorylase family protein
MVPVHEKPFLSYQMELIRSFSTREVLLLVSYLGKQIEEYYEDGSKLGLKIAYSREQTPMGTGGALKNAEDKLEKEFMVLNGDTFLPIDYVALIEYFHQSDKMGVITVYENSENIVPNNVIIGEANRVLSYDKNNPVKMTHVDAGVMIFKKEVLKIIPRDKECSLEEEIFDSLIRIGELIAFPTSQRFYDMGSYKGLETIGRILG